ncbi:MAG: cyclic nucleotide-binding domain-containing protein [Actinomycetota bacterium]|nr:cyclic nucleotide-binding domain-containing protein [Actinomycetota bacterium]
MAKSDTTPSKMDRLRTIWMFSECSKRELALLERACDEASAPAGSIICEEGRSGRELYLIVEGEAKVEKGGNEVARLGPGSHFGELSLLDQQPRSASVIALTPMQLIVLPAREFSSVLEEIPSMAIRLLETMSLRLREADERAYG